MPEPKDDKTTEPVGLGEAGGPPKEDESAYPHGVKLALIMGSSYLSMFLVALDRLIVTTAIPQITDRFHSVDSVGWYGSAYLMTNCAFQPLLGKLYAMYSAKTVFLASIAVFEIGSAVCGAAPSSVALIVGRAIAGCGSAGIFSGAITITVLSVPLHRRPLFQGLFGAVFGLANVLAPLVGGALAGSKATWRWCFYINLPIGGLSIVLIALLLHIPPSASNGGEATPARLSYRAQLAQLDVPGVAALLAGVVCLVLALQWGGNAYPWRSARVVVLLVLAGVLLLLVFPGIQVAWPRTATVPPRIAARRGLAAAALAMFATGAAMMTTLYYLPVWFQAVQGAGAARSGVRLLPLVLGQVVGALTGGLAVQRGGYYTPVQLVAAAVMAVGSGLLTRLRVGSSAGQLVGFQLPFGLGLGAAMQAPLLAAQTELAARPADVPIGTALLFFAQLLGGAVFVGVAESLFANAFAREAQAQAQAGNDTGVDPRQILRQGATAVQALPEPARSQVRAIYNHALRPVFVLALVLTCVAFVGGLGMEWRSVKRPQGGAQKPAVSSGEPPLTDKDTTDPQRTGATAA